MYHSRKVSKGCVVMIDADISNVWSRVSLPELLGLEGEIFAAHQALTAESKENRDCPDLLKAGELQRLLDVAERIREDSDACVILGRDSDCLGVRAVIGLLQGTQRNLGKGKGNPQIFFAGNSFSTLQWSRLCRGLEGRDFSVIIISRSGNEPEMLVALRMLRWMLERRYGTDEAGCRIYVATDENEGILRRMAVAESWESFSVPANGTGDATLCAGGLLPMAVAGLDIAAIVRGAEKGNREFNLRSFENPVWLYTAARKALGRNGIAVESLECPEPDADLLKQWWQRLFAEEAPYPAAGGAWDGVSPGTNRMVTLVQFDPPEQRYTVLADARDSDGLNALEGMTLDSLEQQAVQSALTLWTDREIPVITLACGRLDEEEIGELICFFRLAGCLFSLISAEKTAQVEDEQQ